MKKGVDFCPCVYGKEGYVQHPDVPYEFYVHAVCKLPTRQYLESVMLRDAIEEAWEQLDLLVTGLMTGTDNEDGLDKGRAEATALCLVFMGEGSSINQIRAKAVARWEERSIEEAAQS